LRAGLAALIFLFCASGAEAAIVMRLMAVNPADTPEKVQVKEYLPPEAQKEHILDYGDLTLGYDAERGAYYVYGVFDLEPGETLERRIKIEDVWTIPEDELVSLDTEVKVTGESAPESEFGERVTFLKQSIEQRLSEIRENQKRSTVDPATQISTYRVNRELIDSVKNDLMVMRNLMAQSRRMPEMAVWKMIFIVIGALCALGFLIYAYILSLRQTSMPGGDAEKPEDLPLSYDNPDVLDKIVDKQG